MKDSFIVMLLTTKGYKYLRLDKNILMNLTVQLQTERESVLLVSTDTDEEFYVVGYLLQGHSFNEYPRIITVEPKEESR